MNEFNNQLPTLENKTILYCVLNWGLGHATRSIPLIEKYAKNNKVIIASDGNSLNVLKQEFPGFLFIELPAFNISYHSKFMIINLIQIFFQILKSSQANKIFVEAIENRLPVDLIISDNRFGCWSKKVKSVYITHQLMIKLPRYLRVFEPFGFLFHSFMIKKYSECWIPDNKETPNLSGDLSHKFKSRIPTKFIGPLSRFASTESLNKEFDFCVILSGPEPNRSILEKIILEKFSDSIFKVLVIRGTPKENIQFGYGNIQVQSHLSGKLLNQKILASNYIITRAGYTSIMDMFLLKKKTLIIPTPKQPEQEYLGSYLNKKHGFFTISENRFMEMSIDEIVKTFE
jgi:uncharacterized protein (TIGR00661 family)